MTNTLHQQVPGSQVSVDVGWAPNVDIRYYDYAGMAKVSDLFFVMDYDEQSQIITGPCKAGATSDYTFLLRGIKMYMDLGIPAQKLVMGVPWYGHDFSCEDQVNATVCPIALAPWRGVNCTDLYAPEISYEMIVKNYLPRSTTGPQWDPVSRSPWMNYVDPKGLPHQLWYDDAKSVSEKVLWAKVQGKLAGVGMFTADYLDYNNPSQSKDFWDAMNIFFS